MFGIDPLYGLYDRGSLSGIWRQCSLHSNIASWFGSSGEFPNLISPVIGDDTGNISDDNCYLLTFEYKMDLLPTILFQSDE